MAGQMHFGEWLRQRRHLLDLTQAELAAQSGCSAVTIRKLEAGERRPSSVLAQTLAVALRIPERELPAFIQFARAAAPGASGPLPVWDASQPVWRQGQLPDRAAASSSAPGTSVLYDLVTLAAPQRIKLKDGRLLIQISAAGTVAGDFEGAMELHLTQATFPKPWGVSYSQALPMQVAARFVIRSGEESLQGSYSGLISPMLDAGGNGSARVQAAGLVVSVTPRFVDLFLNHVFVEDTVKMVERVGTGARGRMQFFPAVH